jgi:hypothetical protein
MGDAFCENFEQNGAWVWARGRYGDLSRTLVAGPDYLLDVVQLSAAEDHVLELPLHLSGRVEVKPAGNWEPAELPDEFARQVERYRPTNSDGTVLLACGHSGATLSAHLAYQGDLLRALGPGAPGSTEPAAFYLIRGQGRTLRIVSVLEPGSGRSMVRGVREADNSIEVETESGVDHHVATVEGWEIRSTAGITRLGGTRRQPKPFEPLVLRDRPLVAHGVALGIAESPALDGSMEGFHSAEPLQLDHEDQYRRSEEPYAGPDSFSATAVVNWSDEALYLAVEVVKQEVVARDPAAPPLRLDNEPDEIHADGIQVYLRLTPDEVVHGYLVVPSTRDRGLIARGTSGAALRPGEVRGGWEPTDSGYRMTVAIAPPQWGPFRPGEEIGFDLLVNQMLPDRMRRAGQLVWSGGGGWVWLRGDRQDPSRFGTLELR